MIADEIFEIISNIPNEILQDEYIITLSDKLNVNEQRVRDRFKKIRNRGFKKPQQKTQTRPRPGRRPLDELYIIKLLLQLLYWPPSVILNGYFQQESTSLIPE